MGKAERLTWHKAWTAVSSGFSISYTCTILAAAGLLASTRKSYNRAKSESALLVHFCSISVAPVTDCQY
ncbi:hypothetical protein Ec53638_A0282 (plasmid) [Escherichia coli 53638]|nr:hypothetical protein Ec53638_A0282 [Escherichia coli 53638]